MAAVLVDIPYGYRHCKSHYSVPNLCWMIYLVTMVTKLGDGVRLCCVRVCCESNSSMYHTGPELEFEFKTDFESRYWFVISISNSHTPCCFFSCSGVFGSENRSLLYESIRRSRKTSFEILPNIVWGANVYIFIYSTGSRTMFFFSLQFASWSFLQRKNRRTKTFHMQILYRKRNKLLSVGKKNVRSQRYFRK